MQKRSSIRKYRFVTEFEPTFPDIRKGLRKFDGIIKEGEVLSKGFPKGAKHLKVSEKRGSKNIKELLSYFIIRRTFRKRQTKKR